MEDRALMFALGDAVATVDKMRGAATRFVFRSGFEEQFHIVHSGWFVFMGEM